MKDDISSARRGFPEPTGSWSSRAYGEEVLPALSLAPAGTPQLAAFYQVIRGQGQPGDTTPEDFADNLAATADPLYERQVDARRQKTITDVDAKMPGARRAGMRSEAAAPA